MSVVDTPIYCDQCGQSHSVVAKRGETRPCPNCGMPVNVPTACDVFTRHATPVGAFFAVCGMLLGVVMMRLGVQMRPRKDGL